MQVGWNLQLCETFIDHLFVTSNPDYALLKDKLIGRSVLFGRESTNVGGSMTYCIGITIMKVMGGRQI